MGAVPPPEQTLARVRLDVSYDGTGFRGWAAQPGLRTVEGVLTSALATVLRTDVDLTVADHSLDQAVIDDLIQKAHQVCPYSNATRGNVDVRLSAA